MKIEETIDLMCPKGFYCTKKSGNECLRLNFLNNKPYCEVFFSILETDSSRNIIKDARCLLAERKARISQ